MNFIPVVGGAIGGAIAVSLATRQTGIARKWVALGGAGVGAAVAASTTGVLRQVATGAAIAGGALAVYDFVHEMLDETNPAARSRDATAVEAPIPAPVDTADLSSDLLSPEQLAHLQAIAASLEPAERDQLGRLETVAPAELVSRLKNTLLDLTVEDAVAYLRRNVLARVNAKSTSSCAPPSR
jgi:hypothetical protein